MGKHEGLRRPADVVLDDRLDAWCQEIDAEIARQEDYNAAMHRDETTPAMDQMEWNTRCIRMSELAGKARELIGQVRNA